MSARCGLVVLVGAGHGHLEVLRRADGVRAAGVELSVIAAGPMVGSAGTIDHR